MWWPNDIQLVSHFSFLESLETLYYPNPIVLPGCVSTDGGRTLRTEKFPLETVVVSDPVLCIRVKIPLRW